MMMFLQVFGNLSTDWIDPASAEIFVPHDEACSNAGEITVAQGPIVEDFNVIEDVSSML